MRRSIVLFAVSLAIPAAIACSSSKDTSNGNGNGGGTEAGPSGPSIVCGDSTCPSDSVCCYDTTSTANPSCTPAGQCSLSYLSCSAKANCPSGQTCCFTYDNDSGMISGHFHSECTASCAATTTSYTLCDPKGNGSDCPSGQMCITPTMGGVGLFAGGGGYAPYCGTNNGFGNFFGDGGFGDFFGEGGLAALLGDGGLGAFFGDAGFMIPGFPPPGNTGNTTTPDSSTTTPAADASGD